MVAKISRILIETINFGDEWQTYKLLLIDGFLIDDKVIPQLQERLKDYLAQEKLVESDKPSRNHL